jgi:hypothetical protein
MKEMKDEVTGGFGLLFSPNRVATDAAKIVLSL